MHILVKIKLLVQEILSIISLFCINLVRFVCSDLVIYMQILAQIYICDQEILSIISLFGLNLACFFSAVTLKIRSRSQGLNQDFSMSMCCIHANFGQNPEIGSGYIVHILMVHANISVDTDADADGTSITVNASHSNVFVGYMNCHIVVFPFVAQSQGKKIQII